jgi:hypothetical protein
MPGPARLAASTMVMLILLVGCSQQEQPVAPVQQTKESTPAERREARIIVPDEVQGKWQAVKVAVLDKDNNTEEIYTIPIGGELEVPSSGLILKARTFLPAFIMDGTTLTSVSNETKNPAVQIEITEGGKKIYRGWLFSLYPGTHAFQHPRFSFTLVDFLPAPEKGLTKNSK